MVEGLWSPTLLQRQNLSTSEAEECLMVLNLIRDGTTQQPSRSEQIRMTRWLMSPRVREYLPQGISFALRLDGTIPWQRMDDGRWRPVLKLSVQVQSLLSGGFASAYAAENTPEWSPVTAWWNADCYWKAILWSAVRCLILGLLVEWVWASYTLEQSWSEQESAWLAIMTRMSQEKPLTLHDLPVQLDVVFTGMWLNATAEDTSLTQGQRPSISARDGDSARGEEADNSRAI